MVTHCDDELYAPFGDFKGPLGFGRYENGQSQGNYGEHHDAHDIASSLMPTKSDGGSGTKPSGEQTIAAARRSTDPGVIELMVQTLPSSIEDTSGNFSIDQWRKGLLSDPEQSETFSRLPFCWTNKKTTSLCDNECDSQNHLSYQYMAADNNMNADDIEFQKLIDSQLTAQKRRNIALSCTQKWKISVKAEGVSSRSTLFPMSTVLDSNSDDLPKNVRKVLRPMLCTASLPQFILTGETVSTEKASEMDKDGLAYRLGSYDCRVVEKISNPKRDFSRSKRVEVGRNRLVWSNIIQADDPFFPVTRAKVSYNSLITGQIMDEKKNRRQTEVKVGVRISGKLLIEEALEDQPITNANNRKRKHTTRQVENEAPPLKRPHVPGSRTDEEIDAAFLCTTANCLAPKVGHREDNPSRCASTSDVICLDTGASPYPLDFDTRDIISSLMKQDMKKSAEEKKRNGTTQARGEYTFVGPRLTCVPLEDGVLRTVCLHSGNMTRVNVHTFTKVAATSETSQKICSVCWSDEDREENFVLECVDCGICAHPNCCYDKGELLVNGTNGNSVRQWRCAVCKHFAGTKQKPRRTPKMPSRFDDCETNGDSLKVKDNAPCPSCSLCPHRGGAMSQMDSVSDPSKWVHEVCRIWSGAATENKPKMDGIPKRSPLSTVCALCGTGGDGLTRCAARGCCVAFHPMCAVIASRMGTAEDSRTDKKRQRSSRHTSSDPIEEDIKLCNEYTLQLVQLSRPEATVNDNGEDVAPKIVPIAFCGLHNPRRDTSCFGCLPGGKITD